VLFEREPELAAVEALVGAVTGGHGRVLWVEGPAGIGKTGVLEVARESAARAGVRVLAARADELEREFSFGVVRELFGPALADARGRDALLVGAARLAAPVITLAGSPAGQGTAERLHGLFWLTAHLAETGPLLLAVDDAHWADEPSLRALAYLARRIADLPVGVVVTARPEGREDTDRLVAALHAEPVTTVLRPGPLGPASIASLVRETLGGPAPEFTAACGDASGGNPLLLRTLLDALAAAGVRPDVAGVDAIRERAPAILATSVLPRLRRLPPAAAAVARAVAILGRDANLRHATALTDLDAADVAEAADALVAAGLLAPGRPLRFVHPLVAQVVAEHTTPAELHRGHHRAARHLAAEGADPERAAGHLLATERLGDPWVVEALRHAARAALVKGVRAAAVTYLQRAMDEPPEPALRVATLAELGAAQVEVATEDGFETLAAAVDAAPDAATRARIALVAARSARSNADLRTSHRFLSAVEGRLDELDPALRYDVESEIVFLDWTRPELRAAMTERARALAEQADERGAAGANVLLTLALDALQSGADGADRAADLAVHAAQLNQELDVPAPGVLASAVTVLIALDRVEPARAALDRAIGSALHRGTLLQHGEATTFRAILHLRLGRIADSEADARIGHERAAALEARSARRYPTAVLIRCLVERGELVEAADLLAGCDLPPGSVLLEARAHLRAAQRRPADALADFVAAGARARRHLDHPGNIEWRPDAALALRELGRLDEARELVAEALATARHFAASRALGLALRAHGLVDAAVDALRESADVLATTPARLEHARALVDLGAALRRANSRGEARGLLEHGMHLAHECGATALRERARAELTAAGARPRRPATTGLAALTASERRVVRLAADGLGNRDIAQALFVTTKTVETHLGAAYRKLGVSGRGELPAALR
jgi:DNA-binding NarL/FixJ family response regulator